MSKKRAPWLKPGEPERELREDERSGRVTPKKFNSPEEFDQLVDAFFEDCEESWHDEKRKSVFPTLHRLIIWMGFCDARHILDWLKTEMGRDYDMQWRRARTLVADGYEQRLPGTTPTGAIFALKNMGWSDKQELSGSVQVQKVERVIVDPENPDR